MKGETITKLVTSVTAKWTKVRKAEDREAARRWRRQKMSYRPPRTSLREIVFDNMEQAIRDASGGRGIAFPKRNLFYSMRALIQQNEDPDRELTPKYFEGLLDDYQQEYGEIDSMYRDPRGFMIEPHTGKKVPLGTREVDNYSLPDFLFDKLLYVEKKGFLPIFEEFKIAEKYDMAIACAEGYATKAAKTLLARAESHHHDVTLLCLHDADPHGYGIHCKLEMATRACDFGVDVIDPGLHLGDALKMGLKPEVFYRKKALPSGLNLNATEKKYFTGLYNGHGPWRCHRVELNDLAKDPERFIRWVESKLQKHGLAEKLVPPKKAIADYAVETRDKELGEAVRHYVEDTIEIDQITERLVDKFKGRIRLKDLPAELAKWAEKRVPSPWRDHIGERIAGRLERIDEALREAAHKAVQDSISR